LSTDFPWKTQEQIYTDKALYVKVIELIQNEFNDLTQKSIKQRQTFYSTNKQLVDFWVRNCESISFITLNYDILLELLLQCSISKGSDIVMPTTEMYQYPMTNIVSRSGVGLFAGKPDKYSYLPILKLHGSINWFWSAHAPSETIYYRRFIPAEDEVLDWDKGVTPFIIPPVMDKNFLYNHTIIHVLWQKAKKLIQNADEIYIIGFSFPQTDTSIRFLFQSALESKEPKIYVVNKITKQNSKKLKENYIEVFGEIGLDWTFCKDEDVVLQLGEFLEQQNEK
jgi:hypothetical protein